MRRRALLSSLILAATTSLFAQAPANLAGRYEGALTTPAGDRKVILDLARNDKQGGSQGWIGSITIMPGAADLPLDKLAISGNTLTFGIAAPASPSFRLTFDPAAQTLKGQLIRGSDEVPMELKRTGDPRVSVPPESTPLSPDFVGKWLGSLNGPNGGALRLELMLKNGADGKAEGTLTSVDQGNQMVPISIIVQKDNELTFGIRTLGGFKGTLNADKTEIAGTWTQGGSKMPLTLKKEGAAPAPAGETKK